MSLERAKIISMDPFLAVESELYLIHYCTPMLDWSSDQDPPDEGLIQLRNGF